MSSFTYQPFQRQRFHHGSDSPALVAQASSVLQLLLAQDGSTTRLCETIARGPVALHVMEQRIVNAVPTEVRFALPGCSAAQLNKLRLLSLSREHVRSHDAATYIANRNLSLPSSMQRRIGIQCLVDGIGIRQGDSGELVLRS